MNERIKLLKNQASVWCDQNIPDQYSEETNGYGSAWEDKLAELIVKECATVQHKRFCEHGDVSWDILMEHFGVEK